MCVCVCVCVCVHDCKRTIFCNQDCSHIFTNLVCAYL